MQLLRILSVVPIEMIPHCENRWWELGFPQFSKEAETLLGFLGNGAGVEGPSKVLHQVNTGEFGVLDNLHQGAFDDQQGVIALCLPEIHSHLFCFVHNHRQIVGFAPVC